MKINASNQLKGRVVEIEEGPVFGRVVIDIGGFNQITAAISMESLRELDLKLGCEAYAVFKATSVLLGVPEE